MDERNSVFFPYFYHGNIFYSAELFECAVNFKFYLNIFIFLNIHTNQTSKESNIWIKRQPLISGSAVQRGFPEAVAQMFSLKGVLKNFTKLTGKHLCWNLFFNKVTGFWTVTLWKGDSNIGVFLWILRIF